MRTIAVLCAVSALLSRAEAQEPAYYVQAPDGSVSAVERGNPRDVHALYWRALFFRRGQARGGRNRPWGSLSGDTPDDVLAQVRQGQHDEVEGCKARNEDAPCSDFTDFNVIAPVAVLARDAAAPSTGAGDESIPTASQTNRAMLARIVSQWGVQLGRARNKLLRMEMRGGAASRNPYTGIGSVVKEYRSLLEDAERQYHSIRELSERAANGFAVQEADVQRYSAAYDNDMSRAARLDVVAAKDAAASVNGGGADPAISDGAARVNTSPSPAPPSSVAPGRSRPEQVADAPALEAPAVRDSAEANGVIGSLRQAFGDAHFSRATAKAQEGQRLLQQAIKSRNCATSRASAASLQVAIDEYAAANTIKRQSATIQLALVREQLGLAQQQISTNCK